MSFRDGELEAVCNLVADGLATESDQRRLAEMLRESPERRRAFREFMQLHSALHWDYVAAARPVESTTRIALIKQSIVAKRIGWLIAFVAGAVVAFLAISLKQLPLASPGADIDRDQARSASEEPAAALASAPSVTQSRQRVAVPTPGPTPNVSPDISPVTSSDMSPDVSPILSPSVAAKSSSKGSAEPPPPSDRPPPDPPPPDPPPPDPPPPDPPTGQSGGAVTIAALLVDEVGAKFADGRGPDGVRFGHGVFELLEGIVHLRFAHGADMVLASPAKLEIADALHTRLAFGKVRVVAPPTAKGFTIATQAADYVDLGTEFGLRVDPRSGASDLYVFDGQVNVTDPRSGKVLSEVLEGASSRFVQGVGGAAPKLKENEFPTPGAIGLERWREHTSTLSQAPGLLAYFPFQRSADDRTLENQSAGNQSPGRIHGARWTSGRWPGKEALLFDRDDDAVRIEVPGQHQELTIAVWLKVERLDFELNAILNSDGYDRGGVHFQMTRQGLPRGGVVVESRYRERVLGTRVPVGRWTHLASVLSVPTRKQTIYMNGEVARERSLRGDEAIRLGSCQLGNWLPNAGATITNRSLRGRVDELAIWNRALTDSEIKQHVEAGRPGLLWNDD